jgi:hypothetical protein
MFVLCGFWPNEVCDSAKVVADSDSTEYRNGRLKGPLCHMWERLVHLELQDLVMHKQYLHPDFPKVKIDVRDEAPS